MRYSRVKDLVGGGWALRMGDLVSGTLDVEPVVASASDVRDSSERDWLAARDLFWRDHISIVDINEAKRLLERMP